MKNVFGNKVINKNILMEEERKEGFFQNKKITPKEERNLVNLRQRSEINKDARNSYGELFESPEPRVPEEKTGVVQEKRFVKNENKTTGTPSGNLLDRITEIGLYLLIFLMPLLILPFSTEAFEFNKSFLLVFGAVVLFFMWILNSIFIKKKIQFSKSLLTLSFFVFIVVLSASSFFSVDSASSFWGYGGNFSDSFVFYLGLFVFYMVFVGLSSTRGSDRIISRSISVLVLSSLLVSLTALPYYFGYTNLPFFGGAVAGFSLVSGYYHVFAIYLLAMFFVALYDLSSFGKSSRVRKTLDISAASLILINLFIIDWPMIYLVIFILCTVLVVFSGSHKKENLSHRNESMLLMMMIFSSVFFISSVNINEIMLGKISMGNSSSISSVVKNSLNIKIENTDASVQNGFGTKEVINIAKSSLAERPVLGSGLGTYYYDFFKYKSVDFNYSDSWDLGFNKAYNETMEKVSTIGVLGVLSYLVLIALAILLFAKNIKTKKHNEFIFVAFLSLLICQFLFFETAVLKFLFVLFLAIASSSRNLYQEASGDISKKNRSGIATFDIAGKRLSGGLVSSVGIIFILLCSTSLVLGIQIFRAEAKYKEATNSTSPESLSPEGLSEITKLNPYKGDYAAGVSRIYLSRVYRMAETADQNDQNALNNLAIEANTALSYAKKAVEISPSSLLLWENYSYIYQAMNDIGMDGGNDTAIKGYEAAIALCPNDAVLRTELSKIYLAEYQDDQNEGDRKVNLKKAKEQLEKAQELKNNYPDTALELGLVYSYEGNRDGALEQVDMASQMVGLNVQSVVEIGRMYYNMEERDKSKLALNQVIAFDPNNADAHYILGTIYRESEQYADALNEFQIVEKFNPANENVMKNINELQSLVRGDDNDNNNHDNNTEDSESSSNDNDANEDDNQE